MPRQSNSDRAKWRIQCRERLCRHINDTLGLSLLPDQVRLLPKDDDQYTWDISEGKKHLFNKHLSKHSTGPLMELCREVGISFRAVAQSDRAARHQTPLPCQIQQENQELREELSISRKRADLAEKRLERLVQGFKVLKRREAVKGIIISRHRAHMVDYVRNTDQLISMISA
ncbi:hypothetical protein CNYM01_11252 [Colletotrichum nymphaeae SA-01]|uniref:Uncharacterized protein n=1 Tax=Colletotrichum nymphaeae SA-01 TaxID=1460502 RepID=A0A135RYD3_9PEZI|nr:hypothetical protein CNYM01_11252 [Colletotrichum nymphaeae SA-01]